MRTFLLLAVAAGLFAVFPTALQSGPILGAIVPMVLAIGLAVAASGQLSGVSIGGGAIAALAGSFAWAVSPALGGAFVLAFAYAERSLRVRTMRAQGAHVALALFGGAGAGALAAGFASSALAVQAVAIGMGAVLATLPLVIEADDRRILLLEACAATLGPPLAPSLLEGAALLRDEDVLDKETAAKVKKTWASLERVLDARLRLQRRATAKGETTALVREMLDRQIVEHITSLSRARAAAVTVNAAEVGMDDQAVRDVHARGEALDEQTRAMVELGETH